MFICQKCGKINLSISDEKCECGNEQIEHVREISLASYTCKSCGSMYRTKLNVCVNCGNSDFEINNEGKYIKNYYPIDYNNFLYYSGINNQELNNSVFNNLLDNRKNLKIITILLSILLVVSFILGGPLEAEDANVFLFLAVVIFLVSGLPLIMGNKVMKHVKEIENSNNADYGKLMANCVAYCNVDFERIPNDSNSDFIRTKIVNPSGIVLAKISKIPFDNRFDKFDLVLNVNDSDNYVILPSRR